jgi:hypothetical protein
VKKEEEDKEADTFLVSPLINNCCEINPNWSKINQKFNLTWSRICHNLSQIYQKDAKKSSNFC